MIVMGLVYSASAVGCALYLVIGMAKKCKKK
jgi:hypothetical protein